jgi:superfamily II DNA or RNA helicase
MSPRNYQIANAKRLASLLRARFTACDRSETGIGKTVQALLVARELGLDFVIICPKSVRSHWLNWVSELELSNQCLAILGWEAAKLGLSPEIFDPQHPSASWFCGASPRRLIIFDEAHRAKWFRTQNAKMLSQARGQGHYLLLLSATLIQSTLDLSGLAYPLGLVTAQRYWFGFAQQYGAGLGRFRNYEDQSKTEQQRALHTLLDRAGVRTRKSEVSPQVVINQADLIDCPNVEAIAAIYCELSKRIAELEALGNRAIEEITVRLRARQVVELAKVKTFVELALEHLEAGAKVCLFLNFNDSVKWAHAYFEEHDIPAGVITGETPEGTRETNRDQFNFRSLDVLVLNIAAGGEGISLHDSLGNKPRVCLFSPPESATVLVQALGRIDRVGAKSVGLNRVLFVAGTVEEAVFENVRSKIDRLALINDGDLLTPHESFATT